jgi:hypothetical protein
MGWETVQGSEGQRKGDMYVRCSRRRDYTTPTLSSLRDLDTPSTDVIHLDSSHVTVWHGIVFKNHFHSLAPLTFMSCAVSPPFARSVRLFLPPVHDHVRAAFGFSLSLPIIPRSPLPLAKYLQHTAPSKKKW